MSDYRPRTTMGWVGKLAAGFVAGYPAAIHGIFNVLGGGDFHVANETYERILNAGATLGDKHGDTVVKWTVRGLFMAIGADIGESILPPD